MTFDLKRSIYDYPIVAFDTETSGAYPIESEVIELGAVKWLNGEIVGKFQTLLKPSKLLTPDNIRIHGITNEMVASAPLMKDQIIGFCDFIDQSVLIAHHAPFDLGFVIVPIEKAGLRLPQTFNLCSSLISRALLTTTNHKLQTLIKELGLTGGAAHRAYDDAYACFQVLQKCLEKIPEDQSLQRILNIQKKDLAWNNYRVYSSQDQKILSLVKAMEQEKTIHIVYEGGQTKGKARPIKPFGIVRNPDGDYIHAECGLDFQRKRFYIEKIKEVELL
ncbi:exonuclease domain-containing protein [Pseudobdellovibrio exovorus]|uniref:DNA polymerase III alpha subunit n=1 Tax=Pseudobdellovibrio exovorus JSS TaxID=1184267 RepID=M4VSS4_9BACT|nr:exonuclease domain-containing protein [Pseudobdellovibrio exovorus]AGH96259.1 DNA polymerase III alpha subunit [Pseudobdellovibrio exovorus JSS]